MTAPGSPVPYGSIPTASGSQPSYDSSGAIDIWNLPSNLQGHTIWFDTGYKSAPMPGGGSSTRSRFGPVDDVTSGSSRKQSFDINATAEDVMKQYAAMSQSNPLGFAALQKELLQAGFYDSAAKVYGGWNQQTETALAAAISQYVKVSEGAGVGLNFKQFLSNQAIANTQINGNVPGGSGSSAPVLTDPDTLKMYAQKAAQAALGRNLSANELQTFVDQFHNQQTSAQEQAAGGNGAVVDKNDPRASAIQFVTGAHQQEFGQHQVQGYTDSFLNMFLPQGSSAPNVNVDPSAVSY